MVGRSHESRNAQCEDSCRADLITTRSGEQVFLAVVSDGAGSAAFGGEAARTTVEQCFLSLADRIGSEESWLWMGEAAFRDVHENLVGILQEKARRKGASVTDFLCTLLIAVLGEQRSWFYQIGDGFIVFREDGPGNNYSQVPYSSIAEYANQTEFVIGYDIDSLSPFSEHTAVDEIYIFTDGIQRIAFDFAGAHPHSPFFSSLRTMIDGVPDISTDMDGFISAFLSYPRVRERTDDDTSLVIALRRPWEADSDMDECDDEIL